MRSVVSDADAKRRELAKIHILAAEHGLDTADKNPESEYRSMLWSVARVRSAGGLDQAGRLAVLDHLNQRGRRNRPAQLGAAELANRPAFSAECAALGGKLEAQLTAGAYPWKYAEAIAKKMFHVERLEWCKPEQLRKIVAALEYSARRKAKAAAR
jgi:hypothetical protein